MTLRRVQLELERVYGLERAPDVVDFVREGAHDSRETLVLRQTDGELEIALVLPPVADPRQLNAAHHGPTDAWLQLVEGVSHFVYVAERARTQLPATRLELELQAEVDKFVLLAFVGEPLEPEHSSALHGHLYERVRYLHAADTEDGVRYRMANDLAARFVARLARNEKAPAVLRTLRRFYRAGQTEKIQLALAA
ncbi:MAG: hypothetical protein IPI67_01845 [Myxococcales bacterium]|nr:hypothetical protein [Myxococcales bacterium]